MGMAASQARYLSLVARKTNVEWEGQQINQSRTALANKTAALFNQMLGMQVPDCPDCTDFTNVQYSFSDGLNASVIDKYYQLSTPDPEYNYVVTHHYNTNVYTGSVKKMSDPQVYLEDPAYLQTSTARTDYENYQTSLDNRKLAIQAVADAKAALDAASATGISTGTYGPNVNDSLTMSGSDYHYTRDGSPSTNFYYSEILAGNTSHDDQLCALIEEGVFPGYTDISQLADLKAAGVCYDSTHKLYALKADLDRCIDPGIKTDSFNAYGVNNTVKNASHEYREALANLDTINNDISSYEAAVNPLYVGNCELTELHNPLTDDELAELSQCIKDFDLNNYTTNLQNYFSNNGSELFSPYDYVGSGVYKFTLNGVTQYTTKADLAFSYINAYDPPGNDIDSQLKLPYYNASYIETPIEKTERALLETDGQGRFTSVRFEDDSVTYTLNCETKVNEEAYNDAMNQYYHKVYLYEKAIADINAKTEIIQNQDRTLELRLKQLDTEQSALTNEIDAVKKVLKDNIEKSFKTFGE